LRFSASENARALGIVEASGYADPRRDDGLLDRHDAVKVRHQPLTSEDGDVSVLRTVTSLDLLKIFILNLDERRDLHVWALLALPKQIARLGEHDEASHRRFRKSRGCVQLCSLGTYLGERIRRVEPMGEPLLAEDAVSLPPAHKDRVNGFMARVRSSH
jgi:hypothetical protein